MDVSLLFPAVFRARDFLGGGELRNHLDFDKIRAQILIEELQKVLSSSGCPASALNLQPPMKFELVKLQTDSLDCSVVESQEDYKLICPDDGCEHKNPYSKKTNLLRHYRIHVECNALCVCGAIYSNVDEYTRHIKTCESMKGAHLKSSETTQAQWRIIELRDNLLEKTRQQLESQLAIAAFPPHPGFGTDLTVGRKKAEEKCYNHQQNANLGSNKVSSRKQKAKRTQRGSSPVHIKLPRDKKPKHSYEALSCPADSSSLKPKARFRLHPRSEIKASENNASEMLRSKRSAVGPSNEQREGLVTSGTSVSEEPQAVSNRPYHNVRPPIPPRTSTGFQTTGADMPALPQHQHAPSISSPHPDTRSSCSVGNVSTNEVLGYHSEEFLSSTAWLDRIFVAGS